MLVVDQGWIRHAKVRSHPEPGTAHGKLGTINAIIVHQTDSSTAASTLSEYESYTRTTKPKGTGAHFLIDKDGTIYQTASLEQKCWHVGPIYSRCYEQHTCTPLESKFYAGLLKQTGGGKPFVMGSYSHEKMKSYPDRYPMNEDSIGIEIVGRFLGKSNRDAHAPYETPTPQQQASLQWLVRELLDLLHLQRTAIYRHPQVSRKMEGRPAMQLLKALLLLAVPGMAQTGKHYPLPPNAKIAIGPLEFDKDRPHAAEECGTFRLNEARVRSRFRTYHEVRGDEFHSWYTYYPCGIEGTIIFNGRAWSFRVNPGNLIETHFPDGRFKVLGGKYTDDPSGGN